MRRLLPIILLAVVAAVVVYAVRYRSPQATLRPTGPSMTVTFLTADMGGGVVVTTPEKSVTLIDPGPARCAEDLATYLENHCTGPYTVVLTNGSPGRSGALKEMSDLVKVNRVLCGEAQSRISRSSTERGAPAELVVSAGDRIGLSKSVRLEVLSPPKGLLQRSDAMSDDNSLVITLAMGGKKFLYLSDAGPRAESYLLKSGDVSCSVLSAAKRGDSDGTSIELLARARPERCVVSAGGRFGRPGRALLKRLNPRNTGAPLYRTDRDGTVSVITDGRTIAVETEGDSR